MKHFHHSIHSSFGFDYFDKVTFNIYIFFKVFAKLQCFCFGLQSQTRAYIPITTSHKTKISLFQELLAIQPFVKIYQSFFNSYSFIDLFLCDSSQLCAKCGQLGVESRLDILVESIYFLVEVSIDENDWELDNLRAGIYFIVFYTSGLEIQYKEMLNFWFIILGGEIVFYIINLGFRERCSMFFGQLDTDIANVSDIINAAVMPSFMIYLQNLQHFHHA